LSGSSEVGLGNHVQERAPAAAAEPVFTVLGVERVAHAATPTLRFAMHLTDPLGREVLAIALSAQVHIDPARRRYDADTQARLVDLFGTPERWGATTHSLQWARVDTLVHGFTGATSFDLELPCTYDLEVAASKYFYSLPDGEAPLSFHFTGMILYRGEQDRLQVAQVPWSCSVTWAMPVAAWKQAIAEQYPGGGWVRLGTDTLDALSALKSAGGFHSFDALVSDLLGQEP
jgi:hypothetical protein